jgi:hypothetical protein
MYAVVTQCCSARPGSCITVQLHHGVAPTFASLSMIWFRLELAGHSISNDSVTVKDLLSKNWKLGQTHYSESKLLSKPTLRTVNLHPLPQNYTPHQHVHRPPTFRQPAQSRSSTLEASLYGSQVQCRPIRFDQ